MSNAHGYRVVAEYAPLDVLAKSQGSALSPPFMTLSFKALLVIPALHVAVDDATAVGNLFASR